MMLLLSIVLGVLLVLPAGGSYRQLARVEVRWSAILLMGVIVQFGLTPVLSGGSSRVGPTIAWIAGALLLVAACAANGEVRGFMIAGLGVSLNILVIGMNAGMPVYAGALLVAGAGPDFVIDPGTIYHLSHDATRMLLLADVVPVPGPPGIRSVVSLGDLLLCVGVTVAILQMATLGPIAHGVNSDAPIHQPDALTNTEGGI